MEYSHTKQCNSEKNVDVLSMLILERSQRYIVK